MKKYLLILLAVFFIISCKKDAPEESIVKEKVKLYIIASPGITTTGTAISLQLSGTNIETVNNITSPHIVEVNYPKGESQTVTFKAIQGDPDLILEVSKGLSLNVSDRVAYKIGKGTISVSFVAQ